MKSADGFMQLGCPRDVLDETELQMKLRDLVTAIVPQVGHRPLAESLQILMVRELESN